MIEAAQLSLLKYIWSHSPGGWISLPVLKGGEWQNGRLHYKRSELILPTQDADLYFSPLTYDLEGGGRRRDNITEAGVIFADGDGASLSKDLPYPNLVVASGTPGHEHWYWFLDDTHPIDEWELYARGTTEYLGADPGGWDATQVLRIPGTLNHKHQPPTDVRVLSHTGRRSRYPITDFPQTVAKPVLHGGAALPPLPKVTQAAVAGAIEWAWTRLSVEDQLLIAGREKARDRSKVIWGMIQRWRAQGLSETTIFYVLLGAPFNKYTPEKLWAQIHK